MKISVFGNADLEADNLSIRLLPKLREEFPKLEFNIEDPIELNLPDPSSADWRSGDDWIIIDTVVGIDQVKLLTVDDLKKMPKSKVSMHDFDLGMHLFWIKKINTRTKIKIIGIPPTISENKALAGVSKILNRLR